MLLEQAADGVGAGMAVSGGVCFVLLRLLITDNCN